MVATRQVTVDEFEAMSLDGQWELIHGELTEVTPASSQSSRKGGDFTRSSFSNSKIRAWAGRIQQMLASFCLMIDQRFDHPMLLSSAGFGFLTSPRALCQSLLIWWLRFFRPRIEWPTL